MEIPIVAVCLFSLFALIADSLPAEGNSDTLVLLHVIFRHGQRTPDDSERYPKDPYKNETFYPTGLGQLTTAGKQMEYRTGEALFERYKDFLGSDYYPGIVEARTTDSDRTKVSLDLVLGSLFRPNGKEVWNAELIWQPIPTKYLSTEKDLELRGVYCPNYHKLYEKHEKTEDYGIYQELFNYISINTGLTVTNFQSAYSLYCGLVTEEEWGFELPDWTKPIWPGNITDLATKYLQAAAGSTGLKKYAAGFLLRKILDDTALKISENPNIFNKKIYLYSAHDYNLALLLVALDLFDVPHIPAYGSYIALEIHQIDGAHGFKIYYQNFDADEPQLLKLPKCDSFCRLEDFKTIIGEIIPSASDSCADDKSSGVQKYGENRLLLLMFIFSIYWFKLI